MELSDQAQLIQLDGQRRGLPHVMVSDAGIKSERIHTKRELALLLNQNLSQMLTKSPT